MLILDNREANKILFHLYLIRFYYQNQAELFQGTRASNTYAKYVKEVDKLINEMELELRDEEC